jgi:hypothetical protein
MRYIAFHTYVGTFLNFISALYFVVEIWHVSIRKGSP